MKNTVIILILVVMPCTAFAASFKSKTEEIGPTRITRYDGQQAKYWDVREDFTRNVVMKRIAELSAQGYIVEDAQDIECEFDPYSPPPEAREEYYNCTAEITYRAPLFLDD